MKAFRLLAVLLLVLAAVAILILEIFSTSEPPLGAPVSLEFEREGITFGFELTPRDGIGSGPVVTNAEADVVITLKDASTGKPLRGLRPLAWMTKERGAAPQPTGDASCREQIRGYLGGLLATRPDVDLNGHLVLTLNDGNSLSVINPQVAFGRTKLEQMITLSGQPEDWALAPNGRALFVTLPEVDRVAVVDTTLLRVKGNVETGRRPTRVAVAPDGSTVWVGNDGDGTLTVIDADSLTVRATLASRGGSHQLAFHDGSRTAWVIGSGFTSVEVYGLEDLDRRGRVELGFDPVAIASSRLARAVYAAGAGGQLVEIDPDRHRIAHRIALPGPASALAVDPTGRWVFAASRAAGTVSVIDASSGAQRYSYGELGEPDALAFSEDYVYVRDLAGQRIALLDRARLGSDAGPTLVEIPVGQRAPSEATGLSRALPFADTPEPGTVLVAHPADRALYLYREGMMAPAGTHLNYGREARAVLVLDRSLEERKPGRHETRATLRGSGTYTVAVLLESPRVFACFPVAIEGTSERALPDQPPLVLRMLTDLSAGLAPEAPIELRFRFEEPFHDPPAAEDVSVLIHRAPGNHQWRPAVAALGGGVYAVSFTPPAAGNYRMLAAVPSRGIGLGDLPPVEIPIAIPPSRIGKASR